VWERNHNKKEIFCKLCCAGFSIKRRHVIAAHTNTAMHKKGLSPMEAGNQKGQQQLVTSVSKRPEFTMDLAHMMVATNMPLHRAEHPAFVSFIEKYVNKPVPVRMTLTNCMEDEAKEILCKIKEKTKGKNIYTMYF